MADGMLPPETPVLTLRLLEACRAMERALVTVDGHLQAAEAAKSLARMTRTLRDIRLLADLALIATPSDAQHRAVRDALAQIIVRADDALGEG